MCGDIDILCPPPPFVPPFVPSSRDNKGKRAKRKQSLDLAIASVTVLMTNYTITMRASHDITIACPHESLNDQAIACFINLAGA